jgi:hypothetical protein
LGPLIDILAGVSGEHAARVRAGIDAGDREEIYGGLVKLFGGATAWVWVIEDAPAGRLYVEGVRPHGGIRRTAVDSRDRRIGARDPVHCRREAPAIFLVDARTRSGQSGAAVLIINQPYTPIPKGDGTFGYSQWPSSRLDGVCTGRINSNSDLGFVWRIEAIDYLCRNGV